MSRAFLAFSLVAGWLAARCRRGQSSRAARSQLSMQFFRRLIARVHAWQSHRRRPRSVVPSALVNFAHLNASIHREVTANGVRVFSLCGSCGARLSASATLCEECAQKRSKPARPY